MANTTAPVVIPPAAAISPALIRTIATNMANEILALGSKALNDGSGQGGVSYALDAGHLLGGGTTATALAATPTFNTSTGIGTAVKEVDTWTISTPAAGDILTIVTLNASGGVLATTPVTIGAAPTATSVDAQLGAAWNGSSVAATAVATGSTTFILTAATAGVPVYTTITATGVGGTTIAKVTTTASSGVIFASGSSDTAGAITINTGTGSPATNSVIATVIFNKPFLSPPFVVLEEGNANASSLAVGARVQISTTVNGFSLTSGSTALGTSTPYNYHYHVIG